PYPHVDNIMPLMADGKILPYLDIPFQHASPTLLRKMRRPGQVEKTLERIHNWRAQVPNLTLRSTFIVGFPGETEDDFQQLLDFMQEAQLDRVGCFQYSPVDGAKANDLPDHVPDELKQERYDRFMQLQQKISTERLTQKVGQTLQVLIDEVDDEGAIGRSYADAPSIDGSVYLNGERAVQPVDLLNVVIENSDEYDSWGTKTES